VATRPVVKPIKDDLLKWNIWVYADPGAGKTVLASSDAKVLMWVPEVDGIMSAQTFGKGTTADRILMPDLETLLNAIEWYEENQNELDQWDVLSVDSVSEMQYLTKDYVLRMNAEDKRRKNQDPEKMQIQDYGEMHEMLEDIIRRINDLPINVFYTATAKKVEDADGNEFLVPDLQGKKDYGVAMKIASLMTSFGYMQTEIHEVPVSKEDGDSNEPEFKSVKRRVIYFEDTGTKRGKDRTNKLKPFIIQPTLAAIRKAVSGEMVRNSEGRLVNRVQNDAPAKKAPAKRPAVKKVEAQASPKADDQVKLSPEPDLSDGAPEIKGVAAELDAIDA
jgi:hypothetical protein